MNQTRCIATLISIGVIGGSAWADSPDLPGRLPIVASFNGYIHFCGDSSGGERVEERPDGTVVSRGKINTGNRWRTGNSLIDGVEGNAASAEFNPQSGKGRALIAGQLLPSALSGRWLTWQTLTMSRASGDTGFGIGIGQGELSGRMMWFATGKVEKVPSSPCGPAFSVPLRGHTLAFT